MRLVWMGAAFLAAGALTAMSMACRPTHSAEPEPGSGKPQETPPTDTQNSATLKTATFGAGCFWCIEAVFQELKGVKKVVSGYTGGRVPNPTYQQVCNGDTGHAEVAQITYDPTEITFPELLEVFWKTHDPTTLNRQGNDTGTQYRSAIFTHDDEQKRLAQEYKAKLDASGAFNRPIVTEITPLGQFYPAEGYHQNYYRLNSSQGYCQFVIVPKLAKFREVFRDKLKK
jgi:peptide-methionine (S)-S-oxide reductase